EAANYLTTGAWDIVRIDALISGGITATKKAASLAESLGMRCESHSFGYTLNQAASLQGIGSVANSRYFACPMPLGAYGGGLGVADCASRAAALADGRGHCSAHQPLEGAGHGAMGTEVPARVQRQALIQEHAGQAAPRAVQPANARPDHRGRAHRLRRHPRRPALPVPRPEALRGGREEDEVPAGPRAE